MASTQRPNYLSLKKAIFGIKGWTRLHALGRGSGVKLDRIMKKDAGEYLIADYFVTPGYPINKDEKKVSLYIPDLPRIRIVAKILNRVRPDLSVRKAAWLTALVSKERRWIDLLPTSRESAREIERLIGDLLNQYFEAD